MSKTPEGKARADADAKFWAQLRSELASEADVHEATAALMAGMERQETRIVNTLSAEIAHHSRALGESLRADMKATMEPHEDHPRRIANLEVAVSGPAKPRRKRRPQG